MSQRGMKKNIVLKETTHKMQKENGPYPDKFREDKSQNKTTVTRPKKKANKILILL